MCSTRPGCASTVEARRLGVRRRRRREYGWRERTSHPPDFLPLYRHSNRAGEEDIALHTLDRPCAVPLAGAHSRAIPCIRALPRRRLTSSLTLTAPSSLSPLFRPLSPLPQDGPGRPSHKPRGGDDPGAPRGRRPPWRGEGAPAPARPQPGARQQGCRGTCKSSRRRTPRVSCGGYDRKQDGDVRVRASPRELEHSRVDTLASPPFRSLAPSPHPFPSHLSTAQSAEDKELKERLDLSVERLRDENPEVQKLALELLRKDIRESTR
jgi:hypothetical protein